MNERPLIVVISGMPGSGKTTLARELGDALHLPVVSRDLIKTGMHVTVDSRDPAEIKRFASAAFDLFFATVELLARGGASVIAEGAFHCGPSAPSLARLGTVGDVSTSRCAPIRTWRCGATASAPNEVSATPPMRTCTTSSTWRRTGIRTCSTRPNPSCSWTRRGVGCRHSKRSPSTSSDGHGPTG